MIAELGPGGAERIVLQLAADAVSHGDEVDVASAGGAWVARLEATGARHHVVPMARRTTIGALRSGAAIAAVIRERRPDLVHSHNVGATASTRLGLVLSGRRRTPMVTTLHGLAPDDYRGAARVLRVTARRVIACAPAVERSLRAAGFPGARLDVITNGAALTPATPERIEAMRAGLGAGPLVVGLGRLVEQKDWPTFIDAVPRFPPGTRTVIAGDGPLRGALADHAESRGAAVTFTGPVDDVAALVGAATCLVSTSTWEGLPLSLLEALSLGTAVVATSVDGVADVVPGDAAVLVPAGDSGAVAAAVTRLVDDAPVRGALQARAREASAAWAPETMLASYRRAYEEARSAGSASWR